MTKLDITANATVRKQYEQSQRAKQAWASRKARADFMRNTWRLEDLDVGSHFLVGLYSATLLTALNALIKHRVKQHPNEVYEIDITDSMRVAVWRVA
ncbi:MAG: hypothetical protein IV097_00500 [Burkholderiaceae bacterium]|nr:hypothetical protein [Burkholderiaceae bacterium]